MNRSSRSISRSHPIPDRKAQCFAWLSLFCVLFSHAHAQLAGKDTIDGIWRSLTNDVYVVIADDSIDYFETTLGNAEAGSPPTCLHVRSQDIQGELEFAIPDKPDDFALTVPGEITYDSPGNLYPVSLFRASKLPDSCAADVVMRTEYEHQPGIDFNILWNQLNENYAFLAYRGISQAEWNEIYGRYRTKAVAAENGKQLFTLMTELVGSNLGAREIDGETIRADAHIQLSAEAEGWNYEIDSDPEYKRGKAVLINPLNSYLADRFDADAFEPLVNTGAAWGIQTFFAKLEGANTGYMQLNSMIDFDTNTAVPINIEDYSRQERAVGNWMDQVLELVDTHRLDKMVIDVRNNLGGFDKITLQIASYFADKPRLALVKQVRIGGDINSPQLSPVYEQWLQPNHRRFSGKVAVLISRHTVSAGETFALATAQYPNVRLFGEPTAGAFSDVLQRHTSNGWVLSLSNEVFHYPDAETYSYESTPEGKGISPDYFAKYDAMAHFVDGETSDPVLDLALKTDW